MSDPVQSLTARLPSLDARLRRPELAAIQQRLPDPGTFVAGALAWLREGEAEARRWEADYENTATAFAAHTDREVIRDWLRNHGGLRWKDRLGVRRRLGLEVVRERTALAVEQIWIREELLLKLLIGQIPVNAPMPAEVVEKLSHGRRWTLRKSAAEVLLAYVRAGGRADPVRPEVWACARNLQEHPWVCDVADAILVEIDPEAGFRHLRDGLVPQPAPRHFLIRRLRAERLLRAFPERGPAVLPLNDPSEHVGIGMARSLCELGNEAALAALAALARSPLSRVRCAVAVYLGRAGGPVEPRSAILAASLAVEENPAVLRALAVAVAQVVKAAPERVHAFRAGLDRVLEADVAGDSTEAIATTRRLCLRLQDPIATTLFTSLTDKVQEIRPGSHRWYPWVQLGLSAPATPDQVGTVLAELSREDYGLWAEPHSSGLRIWRGDRLQTRSWRLLHELTRPAPNKRQGWSHTVARVIPGVVRAPPARMAEVTATTTPGERTVIDRDGSWVPTLPTVDDLLDLRAPTRLYSAFGVTELVPPPPGRRLVNRLKLVVGYPRLARLRSAAIGAEEPSERSSFVREAQRDLGISIRFTLDQPVPRRIKELTGSFGVGLPWLLETRDAILAPSQTSQPALAWFAAGILGAMMVRASWRRDQIRQARQAIPLVIGGWGTRGKSGTERIKAGLFHGLGHPVFVKTTGCEAMFISARPGLAAKEIFIFRPQDKSSIWEQADMVEQAAGIRARVMLWECMALRPPLVELLQQDWMKDDLVTLTNAFPDHEDMQGPAGHDIATVISSFVPNRSTVVTSEREFLPLFRERARERHSELDAVDPIESELFGQDLLDLFPYQEHPRNIALVARVAERLGLDRMMSIVTMAEHVVPDLGVLRIYPEVRVCGRTMRFINGMSANERTGCIGNWRRTGCDQIDVDREPDHAIVVVVNNRADRVARSEVFARIVVQDLSADAFVLIGTNLTGLIGYIKTALDDFLRDLQVQPAGTTPEHGEARLAVWMARLRIGRPSVDNLIQKARAALRGIGRTLQNDGPLGEVLTALLASTGSLDLDAILRELEQHPGLRGVWEASIGEEIPAEAPAEVVTRPEEMEAWAGWREALARQMLHARLRHALLGGTLDDAQFRTIFRSLFLRSLQPVEDPTTSGDRIVALSARAAMVGSRVTVMGVQNIKGTGLDFAYRWVSLGLVLPRLARARAPAPLGRPDALRELLVFDDYGLMDSGMVATALQNPCPDETEDERQLRERVLAHTTHLHALKRAALTRNVARRWWMPMMDFLERVIDPIDAVRRYWIAQRTMKELRDHTISLPDASVTMQSLYARQKGGWLVKALVARWNA